MAETLKISLQFGGGAELLFDRIKKREIELPALNKYLPDSNKEKWTIRELLQWLKDNLLRERPELFLQHLPTKTVYKNIGNLKGVAASFYCQGESIRPGILVLINDADWELYDELDYELQNKDNIMFISTLHGG